MEHDAKNGSRGRGNSFTATNGHPSTSAKDGTLSTAQVDESRPQTPMGAAGNLESTEYGIMGSSQSMTRDPPRHSSYGPASISTGTKTNKTESQLPTFDPPVTKTTLSELDVNKIVQNPKLRHDINFDPDLHFRPNVDGEKGRRKKQKADDFWNTMRSQLQSYLEDREGFERKLGNAEWCLPATLKAIREILETLVPQRDRASVEETFNVELLMQQFRKGVADLVKLATRLAQLLKCHCAPMRDDWVDDMVTQLSNGDRNRDVGQLVSGMLSLLAVLEAMKLDVANHQIRCLRPLLIGDTVHFEQKYFMKKIAMRRVDVAAAHAWFKRQSSLADIGSSNMLVRPRENTWDFMKALVDLTLPSKSSEKIPPTFSFDEDRLIKLRSDMLDLINLEICMSMFRTLEADRRIQESRFLSHDDTPVNSFTSSPCIRPASPADESLLSSATLPSEVHFRSKHNLLDAQERGYDSRSPSGQQVWVQSMENETVVSASPSPRSSPSTSASTPATYPPTPFYLSLSASDTTSQARSSFQAILASDNTSQKWNTLSSSLALEILRSTNTPLSRLPQFESHLAFYLSNPRSTCYQKAESRVIAQLLPVLQKLVETYAPLTSMQMFEAATASKTTPGAQSNGARDELTEIATRIAHIGTLHWRVWAPLAYLIDPDAEVEEDPEMVVTSAS